MEAIQAFLKEYDHIPPNEKCMVLLLAEERFLKIKQAMEEEQNQPEVLQELLLKLINDLQNLKGILSKQEKKKPTAQSSIPYWNFSMIDDEEARDNFLKDVCIFFRKFSRIPFGVTPKVILIAWESFGKIKDALNGQAISDKREYARIDSKNSLKMPKAITPDEPIEEPDNSLSMGDEHLNTTPSIENLVPIPSEFEGNSDDTGDVPVHDDSSTFDTLNDNSEILSNSNNDDTLSDDDDFKPTPDRMLKSPYPFHIPVADSDSFLEESDTSLSHFDNSFPNSETFYEHTKRREDGINTTHAKTLFPEYDSFLFEIEPDQEGLISNDNFK
ncbi:hypothetical protein Tco_0184430 [Tanacetum coccineum]